MENAPVEIHHTPRVSIVLPTYNGAAYLAESIQSCLDQTFSDFELIIVDDASTDETPAIIAKFAARDPRVRSLRHETNQRLPGGLNTGCAAARGEYFTWTSDDNRYLPGALAELVAALDREPSLAHVYADCEVIDEEGRVLSEEQAMEPVQLVTGYDGLGVACFLYRRSVYEQIGSYAADLVLAEDYDYWLRIFAARLPMRHLHRSLYQYRRHARSLTDTQRGRTFLAAERSLLRHLPEMPWLSRDLRGRAYLYLASLATWRGDSRAALRYTLQALPDAPVRTATKLSAFALRRLQRAAPRAAVPTAAESVHS